MTNNIDVLKFRVLMCLYDSDKSQGTVSGISRILQKEKYVISRTMIKLEAEGLVDRTNIRSPELTEKGRQIVSNYHEKLTAVLNHLLYEGVDLEHAKSDASICALYCSNQMIETLKKGNEICRIKRTLKNKHKFDGSLLCKTLKDGVYTFPFVIYREYVKENEPVSMANKGFEHPCILTVENGEGIVQLKILPMSEKSVLDGISMSGEVNRFEYFDSGRFVSAEFYGSVITFPARVLSFINVGEGMGQILHGSVYIKMQCSVGIAHMPESKALFTMTI